MEIHLFIIWEKAQWKKADILRDISKDLEIIKIVDVKWPEEKFVDNLSRFYGKKLPSGSKKVAECGKGQFSVVIVKDNCPKYLEKKTSHGMELVNINIFERKEKYRAWTNDDTTPVNYHGSRIHGTNSEEETRHDLTSLFGVSPDDLLHNPNILPESWEKNMVGLDGWDTLSDMFYVMNQSNNYLILRNFEYLPKSFRTNEHGDIDILTDNIDKLAWVMGAEKVFRAKFRVHYRVKVSNEFVYFDFRHIGDEYYCKKWEENMLKNKVYSKSGFYILCEEDYKYGILYHALIHKSKISDEYSNKIKCLFNDPEINYLKTLKAFLSKNNYYVSKPNDLSVYINTKNANKTFGLLRKLYYLVVKIDRKIFNRKLMI